MMHWFEYIILWDFFKYLNIVKIKYSFSHQSLIDCLFVQIKDGWPFLYTKKQYFSLILKKSFREVRSCLESERNRRFLVSGFGIIRQALTPAFSPSSPAMDGRLLFLGGDGSFKHRYHRLKSGFFPAPFDIRLCFPLSHCLSFSNSDGSHFLQRYIFWSCMIVGVVGSIVGGWCF